MSKRVSPATLRYLNLVLVSVLVAYVILTATVQALTPLYSRVLLLVCLLLIGLVQVLAVWVGSVAPDVPGTLPLTTGKRMTFSAVTAGLMILFVLATIKSFDYLVIPRADLTYEENNDDRMTMRTLELYPYTGWHMQANYHHVGEMPYENMDYYRNFDVRSGDYGFFIDFDLNRPPKKRANEIRIILIGGSAAQGWGARSNEDMIYKVLEKKLQSAMAPRKKSVHVINLAMGASITYQNFIALNKWGHNLEPDMIVSFSGGNDLFVPFATGSDAFFRFPALQELVYSVRVAESNRALRWLGRLYPGIMRRSAIGSALRLVFPSEFAKERYNTAHDFPKSGFLQECVIPLYVNALKSIKRDFKGIPIVVAFQPVDTKVAGPEYASRYAELIRAATRDLSGYENRDWYFFDFQKLWTEEKLFDKVRMRYSVHLTNELQEIVAERLAAVITPILLP